MRVGVADLLHHAVAEVPVPVDARWIAIAGHVQPRAGDVIVLRLLVVEGDSLFEITTVVADVAYPQRGITHDLALDREMPFARAAVVPVREIEGEHRLGIGR